MNIYKILVFFLLFFPEFLAGQDLCNYDFNREITIDGDSVKGSSPLNDFTVLIHFTAPELRVAANGGKVQSALGHDMIFTDTFNVKLEHELDTYDPVTGEVVAWVKIPTLTPNQDETIKIWYGNANQTTSTSSTSAWSSDYVGVWHLNESGNGTAGEFSDATSNQNGGQGGSGNTSRVPAVVDTGKIGAAQRFDNDYIRIPYISDYDLPSSFSVSAWVWLENRTSGTSNINAIVNKQNGHRNRNFWLVHWDNSWQARISPSTVTVTDPANSDTKRWTYLTLTAGSNDLKLYVNGVLHNTTTYSSIDTQTRSLDIGAEDESRYFDGLIDEVRLNGTTKSAGYILTEYVNQNDPQNFITVAAEQPAELITATWTGTNSNWNNASNWSTSSIPDGLYEVLIPQSATVFPEVTSVSKVGNLQIESGAELDIKTTGELTVDCSIENNGALTIEDDASLIQRSATDNNTGSGTYKIERDGKAANNAFNAWSSPVPGLPVHDNGVFSDANPCDIFVFDASKQNWSHDFAPNYSTTCNGNSVTFTSNFLISGADGILSTARGYFVPGAAGITRTFEGSSVHNAGITVPLQSGTNPGSSSINWTQDDWNLIGNPYPSAIDISSFLTENAAELTTAAVYIWDDGGSGSYNTNDFIAHNLTGVTSTGGGSNTITNGNIASAQGFFVQGSGTVNFTNAMRASGNDEFRSGNFNQNPFPKVWLSVDNGSEYNEILVALHPEATNGFDKMYDAPKYYGQQNLNISANLSTGEEMVISAEAPLGLNEERIIPLTFQTATNGETKFKVDRSELIPENVQIFLIDSLNNTQNELSNGGRYTPQLDTAGKYTNRFYLLFKNNMTAADDDFSDSGNNGVTGMEEKKSRETVKVWSRRDDVVVEAEGVELKSASLIDASGRLITAQRAENRNRMLLNTSGLSSGIYMVRTVDQKGETRVNKVALTR